MCGENKVYKTGKKPLRMRLSSPPNCHRRWCCRRNYSRVRHRAAIEMIWYLGEQQSEETNRIEHEYEKQFCKPVSLIASAERSSTNLMAELTLGMKAIFFCNKPFVVSCLLINTSTRFCTRGGCGDAGYSVIQTRSNRGGDATRSVIQIWFGRVKSQKKNANCNVTLDSSTKTSTFDVTHTHTFWYTALRVPIYISYRKIPVSFRALNRNLLWRVWPVAGRSICGFNRPCAALYLAVQSRNVCWFCWMCMAPLKHE